MYDDIQFNPSKVTQLVVLVAFTVLGFVAAIRFRAER
jgi:hypothetical protein